MKSINYILVLILLAAATLAGCKKEEVELDRVSDTGVFYEFVSVLTGFTHYLEIKDEEVLLYTLTGEGCVRLTGSGDGIATPKFAYAVDNGIVVDLSSGTRVLIEYKGDSVFIHGIGIAKLVDKPWLIFKCDD